MQFLDEMTINVRAGDGGNGSVAMRREANRPLAGPAGGDGGRGGDIIFEADERLRTLFDLKLRRSLQAPHGQNGMGKDMNGRAGRTLVVRVPVGTQVFDADSGAALFDFERPGEQHLVAEGGAGGRGNLHFATPSDRAPKRAEPGKPGAARRLRLEFKLLADVGLVGFPNVGKSTLVAKISRARPKIADYPFTTLVPNLGVVSRGVDRSFVVADIPGLVEGAAEGVGLGHRFLKHVERTRVLVVLVSIDPTPGRDPLADHDTLRSELERFDAELAARPSIVAFSKVDLPDAREALPAFREAMEARGIEVHPFSAATGEGVEALLDAVEALLAAHPGTQMPRRVPLPTAEDRPHARRPRRRESSP